MQRCCKSDEGLMLQEIMNLLILNTIDQINIIPVNSFIAECALSAAH